MKTYPLIFGTLAALGTVWTAGAAPLVSGTEIGLDFGNIAPTNNFNAALVNIGSVAAGAVVDVASATVVDGVAVSWNGSGGWSNPDSATEAELPGQPAIFNDSNLTDWIGENTAGTGITITFSGLDDSLTYTLVIGSGFVANATPVNTRWTVDSQVDDTVHDVGAEAYVTFTGLGTDGCGNLVISGDGISPTFPNLSVVSALQLTATTPPAGDIWQTDGNGTWSSLVNWDPAVPNAAEAIATFDDTLPLNGPVTATLDVPVTLGTLSIRSAQDVTIDGASALTFDGLTIADIRATAGNHEIAADVALSDPLDIVLAGGSSLDLSGALSGASAVTAKGSGNLLLSGDLSGFTGGLLAECGFVEIPTSNVATDLGRMNTKRGGEISIFGTVTLANNASFGVGSGIQGTTGSLTVESGGELNIGAAGAFTGIGGGDVFAQRTQSGNGTLTIAGGTLNVAAPGTGTSGAGGLDATNFWLNPYGNGGGVTTINLDGGVLSSARNIANGSGGTLPIINFNGGTLQAAAAHGFFVNGMRVNVRDGGGTLDTQGFNITSNQVYSHSNIGGDALTDGGLTKEGSGTLTLGGVNTYNGLTTVSEGALVLPLSGSLVGDVTVDDGAKIGGVGLIGGLLTLGDTAGAAVAIDAASLTGIQATDLTLNGVTALSLTGVPSLGTATYAIATYDNVSGVLVDGNGGTLADSFSAPGYRLSAVVDNLGTLEADITTESGTWTGTTSGNWETEGPDANWDTSDDFFYNGDEAFFDDSGSNKTVTLLEDVSPSVWDVNNSAGNDYTFTGAFGVTGATQLVKDGDGTLFIETDNSFSGGTTIYDGTVQVGTGGPSGNLGSGPLFNDGLLILNRSDDLTLVNSVSGFGSVVKDGPNTVTVGVAQPYSGSTTVADGVLNLPLNDTFGNHVNSDLDLIIEAGAVVTNGTAAGYTSMEFLTLNGGELRATNDLSVGGGPGNFYQAYGIKGSVTVGGSTPSSITDIGQANGAISIGGTVLVFDVSDVTGDVSTDLTVSAKLKNPPGAVSGLVKMGLGTMVMTRTNVYTGVTAVDEGVLSLGDGTTNTNLEDAADVELMTGAILDLNYDVAAVDTIGALYIDGVSQALGTWGSLASTATHKTALITGTGLLEVTVSFGTPYGNWTDGFPGLLDTTSTVDFDEDSLDTGAEYVLGGNPTVNDVAAIAPTQTLDGTDLIFVFRRTDLAAGDPNTVITVEYGSDLQGWDPAVNGLDGVEISVDDDGAAFEIDLVTVRIPRALETDGRLFARLNVVVTIP